MNEPKWEKFKTVTQTISLMDGEKFLGSINTLYYCNFRQVSNGIRALKVITMFLVCKGKEYVIKIETAFREGEQDIANPEMSDDCYPYYPERNVEINMRIETKKVKCDDFTNFITFEHGTMYEQISFQEVK